MNRDQRDAGLTGQAGSYFDRHRAHYTGRTTSPTLIADDDDDDGVVNTVVHVVRVSIPSLARRSVPSVRLRNDIISAGTQYR